VARGEVDAGIVYATDARQHGERVSPGPTIEPGLHDPIVYEGIVLVAAPRPQEARALLDWLAAQGGRESFARRGFLPP
jgi:molybdate transport system substrate-binding protein